MHSDEGAAIQQVNSSGAHQVLGGTVVAGKQKREERRVRFAPGSLLTADGHPVGEGKTAQPKRSIDLNRFVEALTKKSVLQLQELLGMADYGPSIMKLRRRCGLDSADKRPRPYATVAHKKRAPVVATTSPSSSGSWSEEERAQPRAAAYQSTQAGRGQRGRPRKQQEGVGVVQGGVTKKQRGQQKGVRKRKGKEDGAHGGRRGRTKGGKGQKEGGEGAMEGVGPTGAAGTRLRRASRLQAPSSATAARRAPGRKAAALRARPMDTEAEQQHVSAPVRRGKRTAAAATAAAAEGAAGSDTASPGDVVVGGSDGDKGVGRGKSKATARALHVARDTSGSGSVPQQPRKAKAAGAKKDSSAAGRAKRRSTEGGEAEGRVDVTKRVRRGARSAHGTATQAATAGASVRAGGKRAHASARETAAATAAGAVVAAGAAEGEGAMQVEPLGRLTRGQRQQQLQQQQQQQEDQEEPPREKRGQRRQQLQQREQLLEQAQEHEQEQGEDQDGGMQNKARDVGTRRRGPRALKRARSRKDGVMVQEQGGREDLMEVDGDEGLQGERLVGAVDLMHLDEDETAASHDGGDGSGGVRKRRRVARRTHKKGQGGAEGGAQKLGKKVRDRGRKGMRVARGAGGVEIAGSAREEGEGASEGEHESPPKSAVRRRGRRRGREKEQAQQQQQQQQQGLVESEGCDGEVRHIGHAGQSQQQQQQHKQQVQLLQQEQQQLQQQLHQGEGSSQPPGEAPGSNSEPTSADSVLPRPPSPPSVCARRRGARRAAAPRPQLPAAAGRQQRGVARGGQRGGDPDTERTRPALADGIAHPSTSQSSGAYQAGAGGLVVRQAGPTATPMAYLPAPGLTPVAAAPAAPALFAPAGAAAAAAATTSTAAGAEAAAVLGARGAGGLRDVGQPRVYARSPLGRLSDNLPMGPAHPSFAPSHHRPGLPPPSAMLPPRFAGTKAVNNNSGGSGSGWSGGKLMAGSGPGMSSTHSIVGSTHGVKTGGGFAVGNGGGQEVAPPRTVQAPHHAAAGSRRPPVVPGSRGELMQRSLHGRQGTMLVEDEGNALHASKAMLGNAGTPGTAAMPGPVSGPGANENSSAAAAALMPPPRRSGPGGVGSSGAAANKSSGGPAWGSGNRQGGSGRGVGGGSGGGIYGGEMGGEAGLGGGVGGVGGSTVQVPEVCMSSTGGMGKQQTQGVTSTPRCLRLLNA